MLKEKEYPINSYGPVRTNKDRTCVCCGDTVPAGSSRMMPRNAKSSCSKDKINRKRLIGNTYQIYRSILHQLAIDEDWNNVYSDITLPSGDMGTIKVERIDDDKKDNDIK